MFVLEVKPYKHEWDVVSTTSDGKEHVISTHATKLEAIRMFNRLKKLLP